MTLFMETTEIAPERTVAEIQKILASYGANAVMMEFSGGEVSAVSFRFAIEGTGDVPFRLPCRWQAIAETLRKRARISDWCWKSNYSSDVNRRKGLELKSRRIAWRQILRWVQAQMALVETSMVKVEEVFFPYIQINAAGDTMFSLAQKSQFKMLEMK